MPMGDFFEQQFVFAKKFNELKLTDVEVGLLTAVMIMNPGECWQLLVGMGRPYEHDI